MSALTHTDVANFRNEQSAIVRADIAQKVCEQCVNSNDSNRKSELITEILEFLSRDIEIKVRKIISHALCDSPSLPRNIALRLAKDVAEISLPVLEFSTALNEEDIVEIISSTEELEKLSAVARRSNMTNKIAICLVEKGSDDVAMTLLNNSSINISENVLLSAIEHFSANENILESIIKTGKLSAVLTEKMLELVSEHIYTKLVAKYQINTKEFRKVLSRSKESAKLEFIAKHTDERQINDLIHHLYLKNKLSHSILIHALCKGDIVFFISGIAKIANIPYENARTVIFKGDEIGVRAILKKAELPKGLYEATEKLLLLIIQESLYSLSANEYKEQLVERILSDGLDKKVANMRYFIALMSNTPSYNLH